MSSFSSILASIRQPNSGSPHGSSTVNANSAARASPSSSLNSADKTANVSNNSGSNLKRKAEESTANTSAKIARTATALSANSNPNPGVVHPRPAAYNTVQATNNSAKVSAKPKDVAAPAGTASNKPAPKNSFREIMARAEAAKAKHNDFGRIRHKHTVVPNKRQARLAREAERKGTKAGPQASLSKNITDPKQRPDNGRAVLSSKNEKAKFDVKVAMRAKAALPEYKGTMRSKTTNKSSSSGSKPSSSTYSNELGRSYRYASYSDEEEDEEDYDDDDGSDMEGTGFDELEREEEESLRVARQEDEDAWREEREHQRQKAEKRKKLEALAAARARRR